MRRIGEILTRKKDVIQVEDGVSYMQITIRTNYKGVVLRGTKPGAEIGTKRQSVVRGGQFILSRIDARNGAFGVIPEDLDGAIVTNDFLAYEVNEDEVDGEFFNVLLQSPQFLEACVKASRGNTNRKRVNEKFFLSYEVNLPSLADQRRLIARILESRSQVEVAERQMALQASLLHELDGALLEEAVRGDLSSEWRRSNVAVEPARDCVSRMKAERQRLIDEGSIRPARGRQAPGSLEPAFQVPATWEWCRAADIGFVIGGLTKNAAKRSSYPRTLPYLRVANVYADSLDLSDVREIGVADGELERALLQEDDLLIVEGNGSRDQVGRIARWEGAIDPCVHQNHVIKYRLVTPRLASWVLQWLLSPSGRRLIEQEARTSTGLYNLSTGKVANLPVPVPPFDEQSAIARRLEELRTARRVLTDGVAAARERASALMRAVLADTFR